MVFSGDRVPIYMSADDRLDPVIAYGDKELKLLDDSLEREISDNGEIRKRRVSEQKTVDTENVVEDDFY